MNKKIMAALKHIFKKDDSIALNDLRVIYALERAIARLESNPRLSKNLIFKGGFVLLKLTETNRFTRDIDALAHEISQNEVIPLVQNAIALDLDDGIYFGDVEVKPLLDQGEYGGLRFYFRFQLDKSSYPKKNTHKLSRIHIDIGFGDYVPKKIDSNTLPSVINTDTAVSWKVFPLEYIFAEKLQTFIQRQDANSRSKDIFDLIVIYETIGQTKKLIVAIHNVFKKRKTEIPKSFVKFQKQLDNTYLKNSWASVELKNMSISFDKAWKNLQDILKKIDESI